MLAHDGKVRRVLHAEPRADGGRQRHHGRAARVEQLLRHDEVVREVGQNLKAFADEHARRFERLLVVGEECRLVADDFELDEVGLQSLAREPRRAHRLVGRVTAGGVREDDELRVEVVEERLRLAV